MSNKQSLIEELKWLLLNICDNIDRAGEHITVDKLKALREPLISIGYETNQLLCNSVYYKELASLTGVDLDYDGKKFTLKGSPLNVSFTVNLEDLNEVDTAFSICHSLSALSSDPVIEKLLGILGYISEELHRNITINSAGSDVSQTKELKHEKEVTFNNKQSEEVKQHSPEEQTSDIVPEQEQPDLNEIRERLKKEKLEVKEKSIKDEIDLLNSVNEEYEELLARTYATIHDKIRDAEDGSGIPRLKSKHDLINQVVDEVQKSYADVPNHRLVEIVNFAFVLVLSDRIYNSKLQPSYDENVQDTMVIAPSDDMIVFYILHILLRTSSIKTILSNDDVDIYRRCVAIYRHFDKNGMSSAIYSFGSLINSVTVACSLLFSTRATIDTFLDNDEVGEIKINQDTWVQEHPWFKSNLQEVAVLNDSIEPTLKQLNDKVINSSLTNSELDNVVKEVLSIISDDYIYKTKDGLAVAVSPNNDVVDVVMFFLFGFIIEAVCNSNGRVIYQKNYDLDSAFFAAQRLDNIQHAHTEY